MPDLISAKPELNLLDSPWTDDSSVKNELSEMLEAEYEIFRVENCSPALRDRVLLNDIPSY